MRNRARGSSSCAGIPRPRGLAASLALASALALLSAGAIVAPAQATVAGDYCKEVGLGPAGTCWHLVSHRFIETQGWTVGGTANCNGVGNGSEFRFYVCIGNGTPPDAAYCNIACDTAVGYAFIHDHSGSRSDTFTGWLYATE
jgi:hypothetical protein